MINDPNACISCDKTDNREHLMDRMKCVCKKKEGWTEGEDGENVCVCANTYVLNIDK